MLSFVTPTESKAQTDLASSVGRNGLRITNAEGLSQGFVYFILQDSYGFIWFSTKDGLNRYDGYDFTIFRNDPDDSRSIASNESISMVEDQHHNLWINTISKGVDYYIRELQTFVHFQVGSDDGMALSDNLIHWMTMRNENEIWICTNAGIDVILFQKNQIDAEKLRNLSMEERIQKTYSFQIRHYPAQGNTQLKELNAQSFTQNRMIGLYNNQPCSVNLTSEIEIVPLDIATSSDAKMVLCDADHGRLFLFYTDSIEIWDESLLNSKRVANEFPGYSIPKRSGHIDQKGNLWSAFGGIVYCLKNDDYTYDKYILDDLNSPVSAGLAAMSFIIDRSGLWWIGTPGYGVIKYNPDIELFHHTRGADNTSRSFYSITSGNDSIAYILGGKYIWQFNLKKQQLISPLPAKGFEGSAYDGLLSGHAMLTDTLGNRWVAHGTSLYYLDYQKGVCKTVHKETVYGLSVYTPLIEAKDKSIWFGSALSVLHFTSPHAPPEKFDIPEKFRTWPDVPFIHGILENGDCIWLATVAGIFGLNTHTHEWTSLVPDPSNKKSISPYRVYALVADPIQPETYLWAGLNGGGICRLNLKTLELRKFTTQDGLPNDVIYGMLADESGRLWVSSNSGISCLQPYYDDQKPLLEIVRNFTAEDGLQSNEFNRYSYFKTKDGLMLFGGVNGLNSFYPGEVIKKNDPPHIAITDIRIRNKSLRFGNPGDELPVSPMVLEELILQHDQDMLTIQYAALEYTNARKNKFKYQLLGLSEEWIDVGFNREANFTNLDPGTYVFTVIGSDSEGVWNTTGRSLTIVILPAWWQTWWFRILVLLSISLLVYLIYRYRINQLKKIQLVRDGIARDLHDEIGSTLSSISLYSDLVKERTESALPDISPIAAKISESSHRLMDSMSDIVWAINPENDELNDVVQRMRAVSAELTEAAGIHLEFVTQKIPEHIKLDMESRRNFYLIFREALNNAIKYAQAKNIAILLTRESDWYVLEVKDDGKGFDMASHKRGNGLLNMQKRAGFLKGELQITSRPGNGTSIRLKFRA